MTPDDEKFIIKPAVERFQKQYRSQYKSEFDADSSVDTSNSSTSSKIVPKEIFGPFKTMSNLVQGILSSSKDLRG